MGICYLIQHNRSKAIKIGITNDWDRRSRELKVGKTTSLLKKWNTRDYKELERELHRHYEDKRLPQSEWFAAEPYNAIAVGNCLLNKWGNPQTFKASTDHRVTVTPEQITEQMKGIYARLEKEYRDNKKDFAVNKPKINWEDIDYSFGIDSPEYQAYKKHQKTLGETADARRERVESEQYQRNALIFMATFVIAVSLMFTSFYIDLYHLAKPTILTYGWLSLIYYVLNLKFLKICRSVGTIFIGWVM